MSSKASYQFRSRGVMDVSQSVAVDAQRMVREAASPIPAGENIKGQMRRAARALGYTDGHWRIRAAWHGEADTWSVKAFFELKQRYDAWKQRTERRKSNEGIDQDIASRIDVIEQWALSTDPEFFREAIKDLRHASHQGGNTPLRIGREDSAMDDD